MKYVWKPEKNRLLKDERNISFERVVEALANGGFRGLLSYVGTKQIHQGQLILIVEIESELWKVPHTIEGELIFLRTIYPA